MDAAATNDGWRIEAFFEQADLTFFDYAENNSARKLVFCPHELVGRMPTKLSCWHKSQAGCMRREAQFDEPHHGVRDVAPVGAVL